MNYPHDCLQNTKHDFVLVKYPPSKKHDPEYAPFRSVVYHNNTLVCTSPSKSMSYETFKGTYPIDECVVEEFLEGTMINTWYCQDKWHIATRSILGAECTFETDRTFASMFYECLNNTTIELNPKYCYSMVMQHPENRIVSVLEKRLYIVGVYEIVDQVVREVHEPTEHSPPRYVVQSYEEAEALAQTVGGKGLMLKCKGERCKIKRTAYYAQETEKGNTSFHYRYLSVRSTPERESFLETFPFYQEDASRVEKEIDEAIRVLYNTYVSVYIRKQFLSKEFSYKKFLYEIHMIYVHTIRPGRITSVRVRQYVHQLPPNQLTILLRVLKTPRIELPILDTPPLSLPSPDQVLRL